MMTEDKLNQLYNLKSMVDVINIEKQKLIDSIITPEIKEKLSDIEDEFSKKTESLNEKITNLDAEIRTDVVVAGKTIKGKHLMALFSNGRVSWDTKLLDGYAVSHPEVEQFKKVGCPFVTIKSI